MSTYYVNITKNISVGDGSESSPYNYNQLINFLNPSITDALAGTSANSDDIIYIHGYKNDDFVQTFEQDTTLDDGLINYSFLSFHESLVGNLFFYGWDNDVSGVPVVLNRKALQVFSIIDVGDCSEHIYNQSLNITIKDIIFDSDNYFLNGASNYGNFYFINCISRVPKRKINLNFKSTAIVSHHNLTYVGFYTSADIGDGFVTSANGDLSFYGCTIQVGILTKPQLNGSGRMVGFKECGIFESYDSVFILNYVSNDLPSLDFGFETHNVVKMNDNLTTFAYDGEAYTFTTQLGLPGNISDYNEPVINSDIEDYEYFLMDNEQLDYYRDYLKMKYDNFNIPIGGASEAFRITNNYNTGLYNDTRITYGAYAYLRDVYGHIGSFYFGGDYENVEIIVESPILEILSVSGGTIIDVNTHSTSNIKIFVPEINVVGYNSFPFDFSGVPIYGSSPLLVKYHVYNYEPRGRHSNIWEVSEFRWWFDYGVSGGVNDYISCASDRAEWLYCGFYGDTFDVRCCVVYKLIN